MALLISRSGISAAGVSPSNPEARPYQFTTFILVVRGGVMGGGLLSIAPLGYVTLPINFCKEAIQTKAHPLGSRPVG